MEKTKNSNLLPWHRIFGIGISDYFANTSYVVELEKDLSLKQQFLDVVIIKSGKGKTPDELPDGLENMSAHNLLTYKSHQEALNGWAFYELVSHKFFLMKYPLFSVNRIFLKFFYIIFWVFRAKFMPTFG